MTRATSRLTLRGTVRLADALNQLYVLLPVLDEAKHYWQASDEVDKLLRSGEGWLAGHPEQELIARRYLGRRGALARIALERLAELGDDTEEAVDPDSEEEVAQPEERRVSLNAQRHAAVLHVLEPAGVGSVIDLGCGPASSCGVLLDEPSFSRVAGADVSTRALAQAARRLRLERMGERQRERLTLFQGALTYEDPRFAGYDAAVLMEVIEHVDPPRLAALERVVFGRPGPGGRRDDAERRVQRSLRGTHGGPPRRPPLRVDPRRVRGLGRAGRDDVRLPRRPSTASATSTARTAQPDPAGGASVR